MEGMKLREYQAPYGKQRMIKHLKYRYDQAIEHQETSYPRDIMASLGITYRAIAQPKQNEVWFLRCENIPHILPPYLTKLDIDLTSWIGRGFTKEDVNYILIDTPSDLEHPVKILHKDEK